MKFKKLILIISVLILFLSIISFFIYLRFEKFTGETNITQSSAITQSSTTTQSSAIIQSSTITQPITCAQTEIIYKSIVSQIAEYTIDIEPSGDNETYYLKHYGKSSKVPVGILAIDENTDNNLVIQILNDNSYGFVNKWYLNKIFSDNNNKCIVSIKKCSDNTICEGIMCLTYTSLYMENTMLNYIPYNSKENQKWILSLNSVKDNTGLIIRNPTSIASLINQSQPSSIDISQLALNQENDKKITDVLNLISNNLQGLKNMTNSDSGSSLSLGGGTPIKINLALSGSSIGSLTADTEKFQNTTNDVKNLLNNYENNQNSNVLDPGYSLDTAIGSVISCPNIDSNDYAINRVGQCNCNLSDLNNSV